MMFFFFLLNIICGIIKEVKIVQKIFWYLTKTKNKLQEKNV